MKNFKSFMLEGSKEEYKKFFDGKLAKWKIKSPSELSDADKKKFFDEIEKEWTKDEEIEEGKMSEIDAMLQDGMTAEQIAKKLKLDLKALKQLLKNYK